MLADGSAEVYKAGKTVRWENTKRYVTQRHIDLVEPKNEQYAIVVRYTVVGEILALLVILILQCRHDKWCRYYVWPRYY